MESSTRTNAKIIANIVNRYLMDKGISVPCNDPIDEYDRREGKEIPSLYGAEFDELEERIYGYLHEYVCDEVFYDY